MNAKLISTLVAGITALTGQRAMAQHNTDLWPGQTNGRLALSPAGLIPGSVYHPLQRVDTFLHGWTEDDPGFDRVAFASGGVNLLPDGVQVWLEVVRLDLAFFVIGDDQQFLESPGESTYLGDQNLHEHVIWFVDEEDPKYNDSQCVWEATFKLIDRSHRLADSLPFTLTFTNVPVRGGSFPPTPTEANGDFDRDQDVDLVDHKTFKVCLGGPNLLPAPDDPAVTTCVVECLNAFDFNDDRDTDLRDFSEFQIQYSP